MCISLFPEIPDAYDLPFPPDKVIFFRKKKFHKPGHESEYKDPEVFLESKYKGPEVLPFL